MSLFDAYLNSLNLALKERDVRTDTFVIRKTVNYLEKVVDDIYADEPEIVRKLKRELDIYLESDVHMLATLDSLFVEDFSKNAGIYDKNMDKLRGLREKIEKLLKTA
jgi:hypothetical protein